MNNSNKYSIIEKYVTIINYITNINNGLTASIKEFDLKMQRQLLLLNQKFENIVVNSEQNLNKLTLQYQNELEKSDIFIETLSKKNMDFNKNMDQALNRKLTDLEKSFEASYNLVKDKYTNKLNSFQINQEYYDDMKKLEHKYYEYKYGISFDLREKNKDELNNILDSYNQELRILNNIYNLKIDELSSPYLTNIENIKKEFQIKSQEINQNYSKEITEINNKIMKIKNDSTIKQKHYKNEIDNKTKLYKDNLQSLLKINLADQEKLINDYSTKLKEIDSIEDEKQKLNQLKLIENERNQALLSLTAKKELLTNLNNLKIEKEKNSIDYLLNLNYSYSEILIYEEEKKALTARTNKEYLLKKEEMVRDYQLQNLKKQHTKELESSKLEFEHQKRQLELNKNIAVKEKEIQDIKNILNVENYENLKNLNIKLYDSTINNMISEKSHYEKMFENHLSLLNTNHELRKKIFTNNYAVKKLKSEKITSLNIAKEKIKQKKIEEVYRVELFKIEAEKNRQIHHLSLEEINFIHFILEKPIDLYLENAQNIINRIIDFCKTLLNTNSSFQSNCLKLLLEYMAVSKSNIEYFLNQELTYQIKNYEKRINQLTKEKYEKINETNKENYLKEKKFITDQLNDLNDKLIKNNTLIKKTNEKIVLFEQDLFEMEHSLTTLSNINADDESNDYIDLYTNTSLNYKRLIRNKRKELKELHKQVIILKRKNELIASEIELCEGKIESIMEKYQKLNMKVEYQKTNFVVTYYHAISKIKTYSFYIKTKFFKSFELINKLINKEIITINKEKSSLKSVIKLEKRLNKALKIQKELIIIKNKKEHFLSYGVYKKAIKKHKNEIKKINVKSKYNLMKYQEKFKEEKNKISEIYQVKNNDINKENLKLQKNITRIIYQIDNINLNYIKPHQDNSSYKDFKLYKERKFSIEENKLALIKTIENEIRNHQEALMKSAEEKAQELKNLDTSVITYPNLNELKTLNSLKIKNLSADINQKIKKQEETVTKLKTNEKTQILSYNHQVKQLKDSYNNKYQTK